MHDIIIIGAGVVGCNIARLLSRYNLDILILEKENDVGDGASGANSAILHSGYDPEPTTLKAKLNVIGNSMFEQICEDLDIKMKRIGSITVASNDEEVKVLEELVKRAELNHVYVEILNKDEIKEIEPNITDNIIQGLYAPTTGIINPFELVVGLMENAIDNGVRLALNQEVIQIVKLVNEFKVSTKDKTYLTNIIINASGVHADEVNNMINPNTFTIRPRRGEYMVIDHFDKTFVKHVLFSVPSQKGKGVLVTPTTHYNYLIGPSSTFIDSKDDVSTSLDIVKEVKAKAEALVKDIPYNKMIKQFAGNRAVSNTNDFIIEETSPNFINVAGIQSPGLVASPAIAQEVLKIIQSRFDLIEKKNFNPRRKPIIRMNDLDLVQKQKMITQDPRYGNIICRCEHISEAEVIDCINRNCGATTIKGVKKRVRPGFGKCQGGFCQPLVVKILSEQLHIDPTEVNYNKEGSSFLKPMISDKNEKL
jgi:glycerol-3-phosphate dehydrogenase